jgi:hypothetical protein
MPEGLAGLNRMPVVGQGREGRVQEEAMFPVEPGGCCTPVTQEADWAMAKCRYLIPSITSCSM